MAELVPVRDSLKRRVPFEHVVMEIRENAVEFTDDGGAFVLIELDVVHRKQFVDAFVFDSSDVVVVRDIGQLGAEFGLGIGERDGRPGSGHEIEFALHHQLKSCFRSDEPKVQADANLPKIVLIDRQPALRPFI